MKMGCKKTECGKVLCLNFSMTAMRESAKKRRQWLQKEVAKPKGKPK